MKLVLVLVLLIFSVMAAVGTFLVSSVTQYNIDEFKQQMESVFTQSFIQKMQEESRQEDGASQLYSIVGAYSAPLGISENRCFYILDGETGEYLYGSDSGPGENIDLTHNIINAMATGEAQMSIERLGDFFDVAIPIRTTSDNRGYIVGVLDDKTQLDSLTWNLIEIILRSLLVGFVAAVFLSLLLSKTITNPIEKLTLQAAGIAAGDFTRKPQIESNDEIGTLGTTFNNMAEKLEKTLEEVEGERNKLNTLFQHMADGVVAFDSDGKMIHVNPAAKKMLGKSLNAEMGYGDVFPNMHIQPSDVDTSTNAIEVDYSARNRILKILFAPLKTRDSDPGIIAVIHDITEERKLELARREFVANVSHELRTPLTNIKGYAETLHENPDIDPKTQKEFLGVVCSEADRMTNIVKDLLTLTRLDYDRMEMNMSKVDILSIATEIESSFKITAQKENITLQTSLPASLPLVYGDRDRIEQVLVNIVSNAVKYNRPGGSIDIGAKAVGDMVQIIVSDTGIGIPEKDLPRIFERFYRVDKARSRESGGTGMGLSIAKEIIEHHGGEIRFESTFQKGSCVTIELPQYKADKG